MKPIVILADSRRYGTCRSCGEPIEWATVAKSDAALPFNRPIVLLPALPLESDQIARVDMGKTSTHFATCPGASLWRRRNRSR